LETFAAPVDARYIPDRLHSVTHHGRALNRLSISNAASAVSYSSPPDELVSYLIKIFPGLRKVVLPTDYLEDNSSSADEEETTRKAEYWHNFACLLKSKRSGQRE